MDRFTRTDLQTLIEAREAPCVSIFAATHQGGAAEDAIRIKEQLLEAEQRLLASGMRPSDASKILESPRRLIGTEDYWKEASHGLALFVSSGGMKVYRLPMTFPNQVIVGPRFYVKPLLPWVSDDGAFFILALSQNHVRLFEASAHSIAPRPLAALPKSFAEARAGHDRDEPLNLHSHQVSVGGPSRATFHGQGVGIDDRKDELLHFCQQIDRAVHAAIATSRAPLVLAAVDYLVPIYRKANKYPNLLETSLKGNPDRHSMRDLHRRVWPMVAPLFRVQTDRAVGQYRQLQGTGRTTNDLAELIPANTRGELETLFVVGNQDIWGRFDASTGRVEQLPAGDPGAEDLVNLAVANALAQGRRVHLVENNGPFEGRPLAGTYFVPMNKHGKRP